MKNFRWLIVLLTLLATSPAFGWGERCLRGESKAECKAREREQSQKRKALKQKQEDDEHDRRVFERRGKADAIIAKADVHDHAMAEFSRAMREASYVNLRLSPQSVERELSLTVSKNGGRIVRADSDDEREPLIISVRYYNQRIGTSTRRCHSAVVEVTRGRRGNPFLIGDSVDGPVFCRTQSKLMRADEARGLAFWDALKQLRPVPVQVERAE